MASSPRIVTQEATMGLSSSGWRVKINRAYELKDGRVGLVRFIGRTEFKHGIEWIGLELTKGVGKNNGTVQGIEYFTCPEQRGSFVQIGKILKKVSLNEVPTALRKLPSAPTPYSLSSRGASKLTSPKNWLKIPNPLRQWSNSRGESHSRAQKIRRSPRKLSNPARRPRASSETVISHRKKWASGSRYSNMLHQDWCCSPSSARKENGDSEKISACEGKVEDNDGPLNRARTWSWEPATYKYDTPKKSSKRKAKAPRKLGPREIGRQKNWTPAKFKIDKPEDGDFLRERLTPMKNTGKKASRKMGAIETGWNETYEVASFDLTSECEDFLAERLWSATKRERQRVARKVGAIETGWVDTYEVADYQLESPSKTSSFLSEKLTYQCTPEGNVIRKEGSIDIGRNDEYIAAHFEYEDATGTDFLKERLTSTMGSAGDWWNASRRKENTTSLGSVTPAKPVKIRRDELAPFSSKGMKEENTESGESSARGYEGCTAEKVIFINSGDKPNSP